MKSSAPVARRPNLVVTCAAAGCGEMYPSVGALAAHYIVDHESSPSIAVIRARQLFGLETCTPTRVIFAALEPAPEIEKRLRVPRLVPRKPRDPVRRLHRSKSHKADPVGCLYCMRMAPEKCGRHGGPSHSTSYTGDRTDAVAYEAWRSRMRPMWASRQRARRVQQLAASAVLV